MSTTSYEIPVARRMLSVKEVATALGIAPYTVRKWLMLGKISFCKVGRSTRVPESEILRLVNEGWQQRQS